eukprot:CCRYP_001585-RA/>CCRYP_001585-RA protein AED:0.96 eAED:0.96 QI:0/0/0/0.5/1/1/2/0/419
MSRCQSNKRPLRPPFICQSQSSLGDSQLSNDPDVDVRALAVNDEHQLSGRTQLLNDNTPSSESNQASTQRECESSSMEYIVSNDHSEIDASVPCDPPDYGPTQRNSIDTSVKILNKQVKIQKSMDSGLPVLSNIPSDSPPVPMSQSTYAVKQNVSAIGNSKSKSNAVVFEDNLGHSSPENFAFNIQSTTPYSRNQEEEHSDLPNNISEPLAVAEHDIVIPEAYLVAVEPPEVAELTSAKVFIPEKWSLTIVGRKIHIGVLIMFVVALVALATGLTVKAPRTKQSQTEALALKKQESKMRTKYDIEKNVLARKVAFQDISANDSRNLALDWILNKDPLQLDSTNKNLYQQYILAVLAFDFGSSYEWMSAENECNWHGVSCLDGKVHKLELNEENLTGTVPPEIGELQYLDTIALYGNGLY